MSRRNSGLLPHKSLPRDPHGVVLRSTKRLGTGQRRAVAFFCVLGVKLNSLVKQEERRPKACSRIGPSG